MNSQIIRDKFSQAAPQYDRYAFLQRQIGDSLLAKIEQDNIAFRDVLDIGCGTAELARNMRLKFSTAKVTGIDFSFSMLENARDKASNINLVQADAAYLPFKSAIFDLVVSNLAFQWVEDLGKLFKDIRCVLKDRGRLYFTVFGKETLKELNIAFAGKTPALPSVSVFTDNLTAAGFRILDEDVKNLKQRYSDMRHLVSWLKNIGANFSGYVPANGLGMRKIWNEAEVIYNNRFRDNGNIFATFEVIAIVAEK